MKGGVAVGIQRKGLIWVGHKMPLGYVGHKVPLGRESPVGFPLVEVYNLLGEASSPSHLHSFWFDIQSKLELLLEYREGENCFYSSVDLLL